MVFRPALLAALILAAAVGCDDDADPSPQGPGTDAALAPLPVSTGNDWARERILYALAVRQFQDSDGDGMGDLAGVEARLDHVRALGAGVLVLDAVQPTSLADGPRAVSDLTAVDPRLGGRAAWDRLVAAVHARGMRLMVTLPLNHVDRGHAWFRAARAGDAAARMRFRHVTDVALAPPCADLTAVPFDPYGSLRWLDEDPGFAVYHRFATTSPDLAWDAPAVREAAAAAVRHWLNAGADGLVLPDVFAWVEDGDDCDDVAASRRRLDELLAAARAVGPDRTVIAAALRADAPSDDADEARMLRYAATDAALLVLATPWQARLRSAQLRTADPLDLLDRFTVTAGATPRLVLPSGHADLPRLTQAVSNDDRAVRQALAVVLTAPAVPWLYYGDEVGIGPAAAAGGDPRDLAVPPMPWAATAPYAGFSNVAPWWPEATLLPRRAVDTQLADDGSILAAASKLGDARNRLVALRRGTFAALNVFDLGRGGRATGVIAWLRRAGDQSVVAVHNMSGDDVVLRLRVDGAGWAAGAPLVDVLRPDRAAPLAPDAAAPEIILELRSMESMVLAAAADLDPVASAAP